jgi:hypothetical protein
MKIGKGLGILCAVLALTLAARGGGPRVMVLVDEQNLGSIATSEIETMAVTKLLERGCRPIDQDMIKSKIKRDQQLLKSVGDNRGAAALGLQFGSDLVLVGEAVAKPSARRIADSNLRSYEAVVTLRAVKTDNAETVASVSEVATVVGLDDVSGGSKALKAAGQKSLDKIIVDLAAKWQAAVTGPKLITLTVGGVDQAWKLKAVRESLRAKDTLNNVTQLSYTAGAAVFELECEQPAETLSEALVLAPPAGLKFQVLEVSPAAIQLRAVTPPPAQP